MSSLSPQQSDPRGSFSAENAPRVVVRAGKTYVCSSCGTLVEIPAEFVGQLVTVPQQASPETPTPEEPASDVSPKIEEPPKKPATFEFVTSDTPDDPVEDFAVTSSRTGRADHSSPPHAGKPRPARPRRPQQPAPMAYVGQTIDGLIVPSAEQLQRAQAWITFHQKVLKRQEQELRQLTKLVKKRQSPGQHAPQPQAAARHAHADVSMAPTLDNTHERGPP